MLCRLGRIGLLLVVAGCGDPEVPDNPYGVPAATCEREGETRCYRGSRVQVCRGGAWVATDDCGALGYLCASIPDLGAACVGDVCAGDETRCAHGNVEVCIGGLWVVVESCLSADQECVQRPDFVGCIACAHESMMGERCRADCDCATRHPFQVNGNWYTREIEQVCLTEAEYGFPGGWCTIADCYYDVVSDPCDEFGYDCVPRGTLSSGHVVSACMARCESHDDCRDDTACQPLADDWQLCMPACPDYIDCGDGWSCTAEGTCVEDNPCVPMTCEEQGVSCGTTTDGCGRALDCGACPAGPLDGCTDWSDGWSCTDLSPNLCSCSCWAWPHAGNAPRIECQWSGGTQVGCTCSTGGAPGESETIQLSAGGAGCGQAEAVFDQSFCGLVP